MKPVTRKIPFEVYLPATVDRPAKFAETIEIEVYDNFGEEFPTGESTALIERTVARHLGLISGADLRALRERLRLTQDQFSDDLGCGKKSLSRWENGRGTPTTLVNKLLRLLNDGHLTLAQLRAVEGPCERPDERFFRKRPVNAVGYDFSRARASRADLKALFPDKPELFAVAP